MERNETTIRLDVSLHGEIIKILPREWQAQAQGVSSMEYLEEHAIRTDLVEKACREIGDLLNRDALRERGHPKYLDSLRTAGSVLYTELLGTETKRKLHNTTASTLILSLDQKLLSIPWELLHDGEDFLCLRFHIGRIVKVQQDIPDTRKNERTPPFRMLILYDPAVDPEQSIRERITAVQRECNRYGELVTVDLEMQRMEYTFLREAFARYDLFHCRSHMMFGGTESGWLLRDGQKFGIRDLNRIIESRIPMPVLTFSDGCESAKTGVMAVEHLALAFLRSGVRHYIGTLCKIPPASSAYFTLAFYQALLNGVTVGEAISQARKALREQYSLERLIWGSYVLYGHPALKIFSIEELFSRQEDNPRRLLEQGIQLEKQNKWMQTLVCYRQAEKYAKDILSKTRETQENILPEISIRIGKLLHKQGKFSQAQRYLDNALRLSGTRKPEVLNELALSHWKQGNWQEMQRLCQESLALAEASGDLFQCAKAHHYSGLAYRSSGNLTQSFQAFDQAIALYTQLNQEAELVKLYDSYGVTYYRMGDLENALFWYEKSKTQKEKIQNPYGYAITCGNIGRVFLRMGDLEQAEAYFRENLKIVEELQNNHGIAKMWDNLGRVYAQNGRIEEARQHYQKSLEISETTGNLVSQANTCMGLAELVLQEQRPEEALEFCDKASRIVTTVQDVYGQSDVKRLYGKVYAAQRDWTLAEGYFQESLQLAQEHHFLWLHFQTLFESGLMYYAKEDLDKAIYTLDKAIRESEEKEWTWLTRQFEETIVQNYGNGLLNVLHWAQQHIPKETMQHLLHKNIEKNFLTS